MTSFINLYIVLSTVCVNLLSAQPEIYSVSGPVGSTAVLPCELTSDDINMPYIKWDIKFKTDYKIVFKRDGERSYQGEGYKGRVDVPVEDLRKGNCSLVLRDLRLTDTEIYTSYQAETHTERGLYLRMEISLVNLTVHDRPEETPDINPASSDKAEERTDETSDSSDNRGNNLHYLWLLVLPGVVLLGLVVVWCLKKKKNTNVL